MEIKTLGIARAALTALVFCVSSHAGILNQYNSRAAYDAATTGQTLQDFDALTNGNYQFTTSNAGVSISPLNFLGYYNDNPASNNLTFWVNPSTSLGPELEYNTGGIMTGGGDGNLGTNTFDTGLRVSGFGSGVRAVGFDFAALAYNGSNVPIYPTSGALQLWVYEGGATPSFTVNLTIPDRTGGATLGFVGVSTSGDISGIRLVGLSVPTLFNNRVVLDNLSFGAILTGGTGGGETGGEIPEPQTYTLCAVGLLAVYSYRRARR